MLGIGLLGCGRIGGVHARNIAAHPRARLVAAYDPVEAVAGAIAAEYGAQRLRSVLRSSCISSFPLATARLRTSGPAGLLAEIVTFRPPTRHRPTVSGWTAAHRCFPGRDRPLRPRDGR